MKGKLIKGFFTLLEIGTVAWAVIGIMTEYYSPPGNPFSRPSIEEKWHLVPVFAYFFSAALILYSLKEIQRKL